MEHCKACETAPEEFRCPVCGMTGPEISEAWKAEARRLREDGSAE